MESKEGGIMIGIRKLIVLGIFGGLCFVVGLFITPFTEKTKLEVIEQEPVEVLREEVTPNKIYFQDDLIVISLKEYKYLKAIETRGKKLFQKGFEKGKKQCKTLDETTSQHLYFPTFITSWSEEDDLLGIFLKKAVSDKDSKRRCER